MTEMKIAAKAELDAATKAILAEAEAAIRKLGVVVKIVGDLDSGQRLERQEANSGPGRK